jgi:ketosteroid isomerase-like protein
MVKEAIQLGDLDAFATALAPDVVWIGLYPGELCRNRADVLEMLREAQARGVRPASEIVYETEDTLVVDPHLDGRHQVLTLRDGLVSEVRAYPSREAALAAVEGRPW